MAIEKNTSAIMHREHGITEWAEKCSVLKDSEVNTIIKDIESGVESPLVLLAKMPFPKFVEVYLSRFENEREKFLKDPALGFKLFMLPKYHLTNYVNHSRSVAKDPLAQYSEKVYRETCESLNLSFETLTKPQGGCIDTKTNLCKFIRLCDYIDSDTARVLGLSSAAIFTRDNANGYDLKEKMNCLNLAVRYVLIKYIGLYGEEVKSSRTLAADIGTNKDNMAILLNYILPLLLKPINEFKYIIGYVDREYSPRETREYTNRAYRNLDLRLMMDFAIKKLLSSEDEVIFRTLKQGKQRDIFIASRYIYDTLEQVSENLSVYPIDVEKYGGKRI